MISLSVLLAAIGLNTSFASMKKAYAAWIYHFRTGRDRSAFGGDGKGDRLIVFENTFLPTFLGDRI